jgi:GNAT superfamily N-acetyltransferase
MTSAETDAEYALRELRPEDLRALVGLCRAHADYERAPFVENGQEERLSRMFFGTPPRAYCLVVEAAGALVGYATWSLEFSTWRAAEYEHVDCLYLDARCRGRGLGRSLMETIARHAATLGATHLEWQTPDWNTGAARFYESLGAESAAKRRFAWNPARRGR